MNDAQRQSSSVVREGTEEVEDPATFWERRYAGADAIWSGNVNESLVSAVAGLTPGRSLDLGCGEGGDVLWLAARGWRAKGIDLSRTAISRAASRAAELGLVNAEFVASDLALWVAQSSGADVGRSDEQFDLITASFLQSPVELPRALILRAALMRLAPGGRLVLISHASAPPWVKHDRKVGGEHEHEHEHEQKHERGSHDNRDNAGVGAGTSTSTDAAAVTRRDRPARPSNVGAPAETEPANALSPEPRRSAHGFLTPAHELSALGMLSPEFEVVAAELRPREVFDPEGSSAKIDDSVVIVRRSAKKMETAPHALHWKRA